MYILYIYDEDKRHFTPSVFEDFDEAAKFFKANEKLGFKCILQSYPADKDFSFSPLKMKE